MFRDNNPIFEFRGPWGVPIQIGMSILLFPLIFVEFGAGPYVMFYDLVFLGILIGSIFLHELGHAWGCLIQGVPVRRVMIYGGGGFCEPSRSYSRYEGELIVAMGPIVNLVLWAGGGLIASAVSDPEISYFFYLISWVNGFLVVLNLLPVHPLDGGKLFEFLLHRLFSARTAITISASVGLLFSVIWIPLMIMSFVTFGLVLFFFPSIGLHLQMLRQARA